MRRISCLLGALVVAACSGGVDTAPAVGAITAPLMEAPFAIGDTAVGPTRNSEEWPSVVAGKGDFGALWFEPDEGYAFTRFEVVDGRLEPVVHTYPIASELFTKWNQVWGSATLFFDGSHYRIWYSYSHTDGSTESRILTLDEQGVAIEDLGDAPARAELECSPGGVCLFVQNGSTSLGAAIHYTLLGRDGVFSPAVTLAVETGTFIHGLQLARHGESFALVMSSVNHSEGAANSRRLSLWTISDAGEAEGPKLLTTTDRIDSLDVTSHDGQLLTVFAAGPALNGVWVDGAGNVTRRLLTEQSWRIEHPLTVESVDPGFLVSFNLAYANDVSARVMAFSADGTPDAAGARALSSPSAGKMVNPTLASDGQRAAVLANGNEAYQHGEPPYLTDHQPRISVYGQALSPSGEGADELERVAHGEAAQLHPSVSWNGESFTAAWVDNRAGWERLQLRGATVAGKRASGYALAPSVQSAALTGVHSATQGDRTLFAWHQRTYDVNDPGAGSYHDKDRVRALLVDASGAPAGGILELSSDAAGTGGARVATDGRGYLVTWCEGACRRLMAARVSAEGTLVGAPLVVANAYMPERSRPALAFTGSAYLIAWVPSPFEKGSRRMMGAALVTDGQVAPLALPDAYSTRTIDATCGAAGCMLVRDDDDGIYTLRVDAAGVAQGEWTRTPGKALNHPRVAFTGTSFFLTALDVAGDEWAFSSDAVIRGAYTLEYELDGTVGADFAPLDIETAGPVEVASDGAGRSLLVFPSADTGRIEGLSIDPFAVPGEPDAGADAGDSVHEDEDAGAPSPDQDAGERDASVADDGDTPDASSADGDRPPAQGSDCHVRAGRSDHLGTLALVLGSLSMLARRRRRRHGASQ